MTTTRIFGIARVDQMRSEVAASALAVPDHQRGTSMTTNTGPYVTPKVRATAARNGIDLNTVQGTGVGGRIRLQDVQPTARAPLAAATGSPAASYVRERASDFNGAPVKVDDYARNPLLDDLRQADPAGYALAVQKGPAPTVFASGDLPPMLASGEDPQMLLRLPWFARHAGAAADRPTLARMLEDAAEDPSGMLLTMSGAAERDGVFDYRNRVLAWLQTGQTSLPYPA